MLARRICYLSLPQTADLPYDEAGFQARIDRYMRRVEFYERHGLMEPSSRLFTARQCEQIRVSYDLLLD